METSGARDLRLWDAAAAGYVDRVTGPTDTFFRRLAGFLWQQLGDVSGLNVLDVGCGHGWLTDEFRQVGAVATGIDGSDALLAEARRRYPVIEFTRHDLTTGLPQPLQRYHRVVAHMVLMDIPTLQPLIADVAHALRPDDDAYRKSPVSLIEIGHLVTVGS